MKTLILENNDENRPVFVDDEDYAACLNHKWFYTHNGYVRTGRNPQMFLHAFLLGPAPYGFVTDHTNRNKLDNQKHNLRFITPQANRINSSSKRGDMRSIYETGCNTWKVQIKRNDKRISLGSFRYLETAKQIRDQFLAKEKQNVTFT